MNHFSESKKLFSGSMTSSYYHFHYKYDRKALKKWELEKRYLEMRYRYEIAFTAAFKGIESLLGVNYIKKHEIKRLLDNLNSTIISYDNHYAKRHEIF